jgi:CheY-like chemotaxis protein
MTVRFDPNLQPQPAQTPRAGVVRRHLMAMRATLGLLHGSGLTAAQQEYADRLQALQQQLEIALTASADSVAAESPVESNAPLHLGQVLHEVAQALAALSTCSGRPVVVDASIDQATSLHVLGHRHSLQQVLMYLGECALRVTARGAIRLEARVLAMQAGQVSLELCVQDMGPGMEAQRRASVLQGTGGLALTAALVAQMGGQLRISSPPEQGCRMQFVLNLPLVLQSSGRPETDVVERRARASDRRRSERRLVGMRVLVVEDNPINQVVVDGLLSREGAVVSLVNNGQLGVETLASSPAGFDAVLMDLQMPVMDGYAATRCIRNQLGLRDLPIIAVTANLGPTDRSVALAAGMNEYLGKPFEIDVLVATLLALTGHSVPVSQAQAAVMHAPVAAHAGLSPEAASGKPPAAVDEASALARLGGNKVMFSQVLQRFTRDLLRPADELAELLHAGDPVQAARLLHTLKGLAATVGANLLSTTAAELEQRILFGGAQDHAALVQTLRQALDATAVALDPVVRKYAQIHAMQQASHPATAPQTDLAAALRELRTLLQSSDMAALQAYASLRNAFSQAMGTHVGLMDQALVDLDFPTAIRHCDALLATLP